MSFKISSLARLLYFKYAQNIPATLRSEELQGNKNLERKSPPITELESEDYEPSTLKTMEENEPEPETFNWDDSRLSPKKRKLLETVSKMFDYNFVTSLFKEEFGRNIKNVPEEELPLVVNALYSHILELENNQKIFDEAIKSIKEMLSKF